MTIAADRLTAALADRYRIEPELGAGGMATVYLTHELKHDRKVAQSDAARAGHDSGVVDGTVF